MELLPGMLFLLVALLLVMVLLLLGGSGYQEVQVRAEVARCVAGRFRKPETGFA